MTRGNSGGGFTQADRDSINKVLQKMDDMKISMESLKEKYGEVWSSLKKANQVISNQNKTINHLYSQINIANYRNDAQEQYGRLESLKVLGTDELGNDAEKIINEIAKEIESSTRLSAERDHTKTAVHINLNPNSDIQRCHFLGKQRKKVICKFRSYKQRMLFIRNKKIINGAVEGKFKNVFITEDLTALRARLVWFIKNKLSHKFCNVHTMNGTIRMKKSERDNNWIHVNNPDDLFEHLDEEDFDLKLFNEGLHSFQILPQKSTTSFLDVFSSDDE